MISQRVEQTLIGGIERTAAAQHDDIGSDQNLLMKSKALAGDTFQAISVNGLTGAFLGDSQPQTTTHAAIGSSEYGEKSVCRLHGIRKNGSVAAGIQEAGTPRKSLGPSVFRRFILPVQRAKRARPLARRALRTLRPLRVAERARKP